MRWKADLPGGGASTPVISGDNVFLTAEVGEAMELVAFCIDRGTGKVRWERKLGNGTSLPRNTMASPSAVTDGRSVYFMFGNCVITALDNDGNVRWARDLEKDYGPNNIKFGYSSTPLLYDGRIYISVMRMDADARWAKKEGKDAMTHYLLALDSGSGSTVWKHVRPVRADNESQEAYTSPILFKTEKGWEILLLGGDCITSHDPGTGEEIWRWAGYNEKNSPLHRVITSPVMTKDLVIVCGPRHSAMYALRSGEEGVVADSDVLWKMEGGTDATTPLYYDGILYVIDGDRKFIMAVDPWRGKEYWRSNLPSKQVYRASPTGADGKVYCLGGDGMVTVFKAGKECEVLGTMEMGGDGCQSSIAVSDGSLFVRTTDALYCVGK